MGKTFLLSLGVVLCACQKQEPKPNVLVILIDDAGYSSFGFNGGEIETPNIDSLGSIRNSGAFVKLPSQYC